jgi:hypothetical protein
MVHKTEYIKIVGLAAGFVVPSRCFCSIINLKVDLKCAWYNGRCTRGKSHSTNLFHHHNALRKIIIRKACLGHEKMGICLLNSLDADASLHNRGRGYYMVLFVGYINQCISGKGYVLIQ